MLNGHPLSARFSEDLGFGERFWYWRGLSRQSYIHSVYGLESCPPLPGAVFVVVRRNGGMRRPVFVGRFPVLIEGRGFDLAAVVPGLQAADEIHVHLLARDDASADCVFRDLKSALENGEERPPVRTS